MTESKDRRLPSAEVNHAIPEKQREDSAPDLDNSTNSDDAFAVIPIDQIEPYEHNPRARENPRYAQIRESIRADGITNLLTVTRRNSEGMYTTYGGGNTRLRIAKELYAEGDQRFKCLRVIVKAWPGDAQVVAAQLSENELRSDISFWEKALAVDRFRREVEAERDTLLSASGLRDALRQRGLSYSTATLRTFAFAVELLYPLGPWLEHRSTEKELRPALLPLLALGERLGKAHALGEKLQTTNRSHVQAIRRGFSSEEGVPLDDRSPARIDIAGLIADWHRGAADALNVSSAKLQAMLTLLAAEPHADASALHRAETVATAPATLPSEGADAPLVPPAAATATGARTAAPPQLPLGRMLAAVPDTARRETGLMAEDGLPLSPEIGTRGAADALLQDITGAVNALKQHVFIGDTLHFSASLPHGFMVDLPERTLEYFGDQKRGLVPLDPTDVIRRRATWLLLAEASRQYDRRLVAAISDQQVRWDNVYRQGRQVFLETFQARIGMPILPDGRHIEVWTNDVISLVTMPDLCIALDRLFRLLFELQRHAPERLLTPPLQPLFDGAIQEQVRAQRN